MYLLIAQSLHIAGPTCSFAGFALTYLHTFFQESTSSTEPSRTTRLTGLSLVVCSAISSCAISIDLGIANLQQKAPFPTTSTIVCSLINTLIWLSFMLIFLASAAPLWRCYNVAALIGFTFELGALMISSKESKDDISKAVIVVSALHCICLLGLSTVSALGSLEKRTLSGTAEREPLLQSSDSTLAGESSDDETNSDDEEEIFSEKRQAAVNEQGGLIKYLSGYRVFLPYIWPSKNRRLQFYLCIVVASLIGQRGANVLYPRQYGIVIDKLYGVARTGGPIPWKDILLWLFYEILVSRECGLPAVNEWLGIRLQNWSSVQLQTAAFNHVMGLSMSFHDDKDSGEIIKAIEQAGSLNRLLNLLILESIPFTFDMAVALWYSSTLLDIYASVIILYIFAAFIFVFYFLWLCINKARRSAATASRASNQVLYELISNWATVFYFNRRDHEERRLNKAVRTAVLTEQLDEDLGIALFAAHALIDVIGRLAVSVLAAYKVSQGTIPVGNFVALESYWDTITQPLWNLGYSIRFISEHLIDAERLLQLFQEKPTIIDGPLLLPASSVKGSITVSDVSFSYNTHPTLSNISFEAKPGQTIALVGATGAGKSTLFKLLLRFIDVTSGSIVIDGTDLRDLTLSSLRGIFGFVPQNPALFNTSILENVRYGRLDASDQEVYAACRAAAIHDRILEFPKAYHTRVGERGVKLSGGELQRIAIARVILKDPQIILLDEATSALDTETEGKVQAALSVLTKERTTVVIAHRLSTVVDADCILVLEKGMIVEKGRHEDLLERMGGKYKEFWAKQTKKGDDDGNSGQEDLFLEN